MAVGEPEMLCVGLFLYSPGWQTVSREVLMLYSI